MPQSMLEMAKDLVMAMIQNDLLHLEDMQKELQNTHASLLALKGKEDIEDSGNASSISLTDVDGQEIGAGAAPVNWKKSIKKHTIECLICGATFKQLSVRHLKNHDLNPRAYRVQFGIPRTQPLSAKETTAMRKKIVQRSRPWEKAPTYIKAQGGAASNGSAAKVSRAKAATSN